MPRSVIAAFVFMASIIGCGQDKASGNDTDTRTDSPRQGKAFVETTTRDLGTLKYGDVAGAKFKIKNTGDGPITISDIEKGCACTEVKYESSPIAGGSERTIEVIFDSKGLSGYQYKTIAVILEGCDAKRVKLAITANIEY